MPDDHSKMYQRGAETMQAIGNAAPGPGRDRFPSLPPEQADDVQRKLTEFCFGDTWGREGSHIDLKTRRLLTIAALVVAGQGAPVAGPHRRGAQPGDHARGDHRGDRPPDRVRRLPVRADGAGDRQRGHRLAEVAARGSRRFPDHEQQSADDESVSGAIGPI